MAISTRIIKGVAILDLQGEMTFISLARFMHRFLSRSDESADLTRAGAPACGSEAPANVLYGTLRRPTERNTGRADEFVAVVENLCIIRASPGLDAYREGLSHE